MGMQEAKMVKIVKTPDVCGGDARIDGSRIRVIDIVIPYRIGKTPEEIVDMYPHINLAAVHAALSYYFSNREEIEKEEAETKKLIQKMRKQFPSKT